MKTIFPELNRNHPLADIPIKGLTSYLVDTVDSQTLYSSSIKDLELEDHSHANLIGFIFEGKLDLMISGRKKTYTKGDRFYISKGIKYSAFIYAGYSGVNIYMAPNRFKAKF